MNANDEYELVDFSQANLPVALAGLNKDRKAIVAAKKRLDEFEKKAKKDKWFIWGALALAIVGLSFGFYAIMATPETDAIVQTVLKQVPASKDYDSEILAIKTKAAAIDEKVKPLLGNPGELAELKGQMNSGFSNRNKVDGETSSRITAIQTEVSANKIEMESVNGKLDKLLAQSTTPRTPEAETPTANGGETPAGALRVVFEQYDPNKHKQVTPEKAGQTTTHQGWSSTTFKLGPVKRYLLADGKLVYLRSVLCSDGSMLRAPNEDDRPKLEDNTLTPVPFKVEETTKEGKRFNPFWFVPK